MKKKMNKKQIFEIVALSVSGAVALWGLVYIVLGMIANYAPVTTDPIQLVVANKEFAKVFGLDMFGWGLIILGIGALLATIILLAYAGSYDREYEKSQRRALRRQGIETIQTADEVIDAEVE